MTREEAIKELTQLLHEDFLSEYSEAIRTAIKALESESRMRYVQETVNTIMNSCNTDSIVDKVMRNAARFVQNAIDGSYPDFEELDQDPCDDAVSRQAEIDAIDKWVKSMHVLITLPANEVTPLFESVHELPSVTPQPKIGKWIYRKEEDSYRCSLCTFPCHKDNMGATPTRYCAECGANMQEVEE